MSELKACPFCGGEASIKSESDPDFFGRFHWIECVKCRARSASHFVSNGNDYPQYYQEVRESWDGRPSIHDCAEEMYDTLSTLQVDSVGDEVKIDALLAKARGEG